MHAAGARACCPPGPTPRRRRAPARRAGAPPGPAPGAGTRPPAPDTGLREWVTSTSCLGLQDVVEDPLQRFGERRRGVLHPRGSGPRRSPTNRAVRPPGASSGPGPPQRRGGRSPARRTSISGDSDPATPTRRIVIPAICSRRPRTDCAPATAPMAGSTSVGATPARHTPRRRRPSRPACWRALGARAAASAARPGQETDPERLDEGRHGQPAVSATAPRPAASRSRPPPAVGQPVDQGLQQQPLADERGTRRQRGRRQRTEAESRGGAGIRPAARPGRPGRGPVACSTDPAERNSRS